MESSLLGIFIGHLFGDLIFQVPWIGRNKGSNYMILVLHVIIYTLCLFDAMQLIAKLNFHTAAIFAYMNGLLHFVTDRESAPAIKKAKQLGNRRRALIYLLLDQITHMLGFLATYSIFYI